MTFLLISLIVLFLLDIIGRFFPHTCPSAMVKATTGVINLGMAAMLLLALARSWQLP